MIKCFEETEMSQRIYFMLFNSWSISVLDLKVSVVSTSSTLLYYLWLFLKDKHQPFSKQNYLPKKEETIRACIGGNVTLKFKPTIFPHMKILTYFWNKIWGSYKDPSFAKFVPSEQGSFQTFYEDELHSKGRIFHHTDEPATLYLTNLDEKWWTKSDEQKYILNTVYQNILHSSLSTINLEVQGKSCDLIWLVNVFFCLNRYHNKERALMFAVLFVSISNIVFQQNILSFTMYF